MYGHNAFDPRHARTSSGCTTTWRASRGRYDLWVTHSRASLLVKMRIFIAEVSSLENGVVLEVNRLGEYSGNHVKLTLS